MKRVLLIDDDRPFLQALARELIMHGYRVEEANDGLEGIEKALQDPPDLAVVDLILPRVGGGEVVSFFRENPSLASTPIVLLSGVLVESAPAVNAIDADCVLNKGPLPETSRLVLAALDRLSQGPRDGKHVIAQPGLRERRQVVELLQITRDLGSVLEGAAAGILELDASGRVAYANGRAEELLGIERPSLIGADILSVVPRTVVTAVRRLLARFDQDPGPASRSMSAVIDDHAVRVVLTSLWSDGARRSIVVTLVEVTVDAEIYDRPTRLLQYLSHEMRASLLMMETSLRALATRPAGGDIDVVPPDLELDRVAPLPFLAQEAGRLLRLLGDAAKFHRTLRDLSDIEMEPVDLVGVIKDSISGITPLAVPQGIEVGYRGGEISSRVWGHYDTLLQVLYNLLLNALKFTPRGGRVWVDVATGARESTVTVSDTGRGMSADELREVMAQAQRAEVFLSQKSKRVGLGLAIAHHVIRAHRGHLTAESQLGAGTRFSFSLAMAPAQASQVGAGDPRWTDR